MHAVAHQAPTPGAMSMEQQQEYAGMHGAGSTPLEVTNSTSGGNAAWALFDNVHRVAKEDVKVLGRIGEGAFGEVSLATCAIFGKVAVKWLKVRIALLYSGHLESQLCLEVISGTGGLCAFFRACAAR